MQDSLNSRQSSGHEGVEDAISRRSHSCAVRQDEEMMSGVEE